MTEAIPISENRPFQFIIAKSKRQWGWENFRIPRGLFPVAYSPRADEKEWRFRKPVQVCKRQSSLARGQRMSAGFRVEKAGVVSAYHRCCTKALMCRS
jgi:pyruvate kinase